MFKLIAAAFLFVSVSQFDPAEGAGFQQSCKQNTDCTSVSGNNLVCDVRPPIPTFTCLKKAGVSCSQYMDCANNLYCNGADGNAPTNGTVINGICGCDAVNIYFNFLLNRYKLKK